MGKVEPTDEDLGNVRACEAECCPVAIRRPYLFCKNHWELVPDRDRLALWGVYERGCVLEDLENVLAPIVARIMTAEKRRQAR